ncbi:hypothetical protein ANANG_G00020990 [Anguilla anguilla]|uniref:Uncharacterized protein n=1 Tax=Anguilla anguilla TaxID=7936 RepID=A0A9D3N0F5_ANGAN|nr:hypothetical protein ANANG_G00020990 [Anguilla anguilla]
MTYFQCIIIASVYYKCFTLHKYCSLPFVETPAPHCVTCLCMFPPPYVKDGSNNRGDGQEKEEDNQSGRQLSIKTLCRMLAEMCQKDYHKEKATPA